jgi:mRNA interferase MazF
MVEVMRRGEIWVARLNPNSGAEIGKIRPVVILMEQHLLDAGSSVVMAAPLTTQYWPGLAALRVTVPARDRLLKDSHIVLEQTRALDRSRFGEFPLSRLTQAEMSLVEQRLMLMFGIFIPAQNV